MDAVLPLTLRDYERSLLLRRSLARFFTGLGTLHMVVPTRELADVEQRLAAHPADGVRVSLVAEDELVPELRSFPRLRGWYRQQLAKLAIADRVASPFYITFDADVLATRPVSPDDLAPGGRAPCHVLENDDHPDWYRGSARVLGQQPVREGILHNVTPAVLSRNGVRELARFLGDRCRAGQFAPGLQGLRQRIAKVRFAKHASFEPWRLYLASGAPWTEYALYFTFLETSGRFDEYHTLSPLCIYDVERSIWRSKAKTFDDFDPAPLFEGSGPPYFVVIQSNARISPVRVGTKVEEYLGIL
jgi:hypothetical protein